MRVLKIEPGWITEMRKLPDEAGADIERALKHLSEANRRLRAVIGTLTHHSMTTNQKGSPRLSKRTASHKGVVM